MYPGDRISRSRLSLLLLALGIIAASVVVVHSTCGRSSTGASSRHRTQTADTAPAATEIPADTAAVEPTDIAPKMESVKHRPIEVHVFGKGQPTVLIVAGVHGNEKNGVDLARELIKRLHAIAPAQFNRKVVVMPLVNPDGYAANTRVNADGVDLNRNFPSANFGKIPTTGRHYGGSVAGSEPETKAVMHIVDSYKPDTIVSIHCPLACVNYSGPSDKLASVISRITGLPPKGSIGYPTPGSMGSYYGGERKLKLITLELDGLGQGDWSRYGNALLAAAGFKVEIPAPVAPKPAAVTVTSTKPSPMRPTCPVVCIDPGHPSETSTGLAQQNGVTEVEINWKVAQRLAELLESRGVSVVMTKSSVDELVTNRRRAEIANEAHASLLIRLHCDSGGGRGFALYYPDRQGTNAGVTGPSDDIIAGSQYAAETIHLGMSPLLRKLKDNGVRGDSETKVGGKQGALTGSIFSRVPAVTVEMLFLSDRSDAALIKSVKGRETMAEALAAGVVDYLQACGVMPKPTPDAVPAALPATDERDTGTPTDPVP